MKLLNVAYAMKFDNIYKVEKKQKEKLKICFKQMDIIFHTNIIKKRHSHYIKIIFQIVSHISFTFKN